ncbi:MAG: DUF1640 domain-containing protein [Magnetococcales bacterium]|nr:DUF1640 domain-containing protein [Magnetococcales bacterium]
MTAITFDTLKFVRRLRDAGVEEKQAEALSEALREIQDTQLKDLATKGDTQEIKRDIKELEMRIDSRLEKDLASIRADILLIKWMLALVITATVLPALKSLIG